MCGRGIHTNTNDIPAIYCLFYVARRCSTDIASPDQETIDALGVALGDDQQQFANYVKHAFSFQQQHPELCEDDQKFVTQICAQPVEPLCQQATLIAKTLYDQGALQMDKSLAACSAQVHKMGIVSALTMGLFGAFAVGKCIRNREQPQEKRGLFVSP